ncbi:MAG: hypothetical protein AAFR82_06700 [Pseudomonadota bacterium]
MTKRVVWMGGASGYWSEGDMAVPQFLASAMLRILSQPMSV